MGFLSDAAGDDRNPGGAPHRLPAVLKKLPPDEAQELRDILSQPPEDVNWAALREAMADRGFVHSSTTWRRWADDLKRRPERF